MAKIRVHELAKELGIPSKEMVNTLQKLGLDVKNHMSTMEDSQANWVRKRLARPGAQPNSAPAVAETRPEANKIVRPAETPPTHRKEGLEPPKDPKMQAPHAEPRPKTSNSPTSQPVARQEKKPGMPQNQNVSFQRDRRPNPPGNVQAKQQRTPVRPQDNRPPSGDANRHPVGGQGRPQAAPHPKVQDNRPSAPVPGQVDKGRGPGNPPPKRTDFRPGPSAARAIPADYDDGEQNKTVFNKAKPAGKKVTAAKKDYSRPQKKGKHKKKREDIDARTPDMISIGDSIQVRELAEKINKSSAEIVKKLMELGSLVTINQEIDYDTVEILMSLFGIKVEREISDEARILEEIIDDEASLQPRSPIVTVMGHVDHGKTSLLDKIRKSDVASGEAGGITQHIGAYQVTVNGNRITFIDTPGHEAFTAMRARGANLTDIVILVVAADDGVMPQTVEAINHIRAANVPFLVALNKIDKPGANPDKVMQQLTEYNIVPEEWGGDTMFIPVSAKTGFGIDTLLEMLLLIAEVHELKANPNRNAEGLVIEGQLDKGKGAVATVLVQKGTLQIGDFVVCGVNWCKVRAMTDYRGRKVDKAYPSMPVEITGWSGVPEAGERVQVCDEKVAKELANLRINEKKLEEQKRSSRISLDDFFKQMQDAEVKELNLIIKGDVQGSIEALAGSLLRLSTNEVKVNVIHSAVGAVTETDVMLASASNAIIIGFNVRPDVKARKYAELENIDVRLYRVIYEAIDDVKKAMEGLLDPVFKEKYMGRAEVRATFKVPNVGTVAGSYVIDGKIQRNGDVRVLRDGVIVYEGKLASLRRFKDDVKEVVENYECGIGIKDFNDVKEGDIIEAFTMEEIPREL